MRFIRTRQATAFFIFGSLIFSFVMFVGINRGLRMPLTVQFPDMDEIAQVAGVKFQDHRFVVPPDMYNHRVEYNIHTPKLKFVTFNASDKIDLNRNGLSKLPKTPKQNMKHFIDRYLIEYSAFQDNERLREDVLIVENNSRTVNEKVWFHKKVDGDGKVVYDDGIVDQLLFKPLSYVKKLHKLNLANFNEHSNKFEMLEDLDKYLNHELKLIRNKSLSFTLENNILKAKNISSQPMKQNVPDWKNLLKIIYLPDGLPTTDFLHRDSLSNMECLVSACHLTDDVLLKDVAHATLFQNFPVELNPKPLGQLWIIWLLESPANSFMINKLDFSVNWTATFRADSTIVSPYAKYLHGNDSSGIPEMEGQCQHHKKNFAAGKTKPVAWLVSNCFSTNNRLEFVKELNKFISVDIYGKCGKDGCEKNDKAKCYRQLSTEYKFYLAFENSNCDYYITEKLFENALNNDIVPIVMGARRSDYEKVAPPNSFIHVDDFETVQELANYLLLVDKDDALYNSYLAWKGNGRFIDTKFWCRVCALLHDDDKPHMWYDDMEMWWKHYGTCRVGKWTRKNKSGVKLNDE